ncbi:MAG TPA: VTT domain-containing protein [Thermoanaerobaculia bacterium]
MTRRGVAKLAVLLIVAGVIAAIYFSPFRQHLNRNEVLAAVELSRGVWYGPLILIALYAIGCIFAIPASLFIIVAGFIWGWKLGGAYAMIGGVLGATMSFLVGRFVGEGLLQKFGRVGTAVTKQVDHAGFKSLLVLRLIPLFPFAVLNYGSGVAGVRLSDFVFATAIGLAPSNFVFAYCSDALFNGTMTEGDALKRLAIVAVLMISIVLIPTLLKRRMRPLT